MEFSLGSAPTVRSPESLPTASLAADRFRFSVTYAPGNGGHTRHIDFSTTLGTWAESGTMINRVIAADGRFTDTWESPVVVTSGNPRQFARLRLTVP